MKLNKIYRLEIQLLPQGEQAGNFLVVTPPISMEFRVDRRRGGKKNSATIKLYNLAERNRALIFRDRYDRFNFTEKISQTNYPRDVRLYAGYESDGEKLSLIFAGALYQGQSRRRGPDYVTELECNEVDVFRYIKNSSFTLDKNLSKREIISKLYKDLFGSQVAATGIIGDFTGVAKRGQAILGPTYKLLQDTTDNNFYIDNGRPIAMLPDETFDNPDFRVLSADSGLLNAPQKSGTRINAQLLFTPNLQIGQKVIVDGYRDTQYNAAYKVLGITHSGIISPTHDAPTTTTVLLYNGDVLRDVPLPN